MPYALAAALSSLGLFLLLWHIAKWYRPTSIAQLPGPPAESWLVGNIPTFVRADNAGETEIEWTEKYGLAFRSKGCFGEDILYLSDPKALQHILNKSAYKYPKTNEARWRLRLTAGSGIVWADGAQHSRHRKVMNPGFSHSALKGYLPLFLDTARRTTEKWKATLHEQKCKSTVLNVSEYLGKTTLDAIGEAAFGYKFDSINGGETELYKAYDNLFTDVHFMQSDFTIMFRRFLGYIPPWLSSALSRLPKKDLRRLSHYMATARNVAKEVIDKQMAAHMDGKEGGKDVMGIFVQANSSEDPSRQLGEEEVVSQITLMLGGHETTANTLSWALYELSKHPEVQKKVRKEVRAARANAVARGDQDVTIADLDSMHYTVAVMKETLRYHPIVQQNFRQAGYDDIIPLSTAQRTVKGDTITTLPVSQGQVILLSFVAYNRLRSVWGEDADSWRPERFLEDLPSKNRVNLGVYGNLATFSSGVRSCIGWRFSVLEMQAILIQLIDEFEFSPPPGDVEIRRALASQLQPMVRGEEDKGKQMPLTVTALRRGTPVQESGACLHSMQDGIALF